MGLDESIKITYGLEEVDQYRNLMTKVVFSLGSNCGDREANVRDGIRWLSSILTDCVSSPVYATPDAHGGARQYMNAVVKGHTDMPLDEMVRLCKQHEIECGRTAEARHAGNVPIDIDIVVWNNDIIRPKDYRSEYFRIGYSTFPSSFSD